MPCASRLPRRTLLTAALALAGLVPRGAALAAPSRPITIVVPTAAGGGNDAIARMLAQKLVQLLGQPVVVDNKAGANGAIASEYVARAAPDGNTLLFGYIGTHGMNPALQKLRYDPVADFAPIGMVCYSPTLMVLNPKVAASSVQDLVRLSQAEPERYNYASAGNGTAPHFAAEMFKLETGAKLAHVPYKGSAPAMTDTIAGQTQVMFPSLFSAYPYVRSGKLTALAIAGPSRSAQMPEVPTLQELGIAGVDVTQWYALFAPALTPEPVVQHLNQALVAALADKALARRIEDHGAVIDPGSPEALGQTVRQELAKWRSVVARAGIGAD